MRQILLSSALLCAAGAVQAQDQFRTAADPTEIRGTDLIGMRVYASEAAVEGDAVLGADEGWDDVGEVNDLILSRDGSVEAVLVDIGGFLGIGERQVAVSMTSLRFVADDATDGDLGDFFLVMAASRAVLEGAPEYGLAAAEGAVEDTAAATGAGVGAAVGGAVGSAVDETADGVDAATADAEMAVEEGLDESEAAVDATADAATDVAEGARVPVTREGFLPADMGTLTADALQGAAVYDAADERIGEVSELQLTPEGQVEDVVVDVGGFLGIGEKPVLLPMAEIDILRQDGGDEVRVYLSQSRDALEAMDTYQE